jgi:CubicO group peptidase (beta-lactamase class C family)
VREATQTQITDRVKTGRIGYLGYGYLTWVGTLPGSNSYWAVGYGGQRIGWNRDNTRMLIVFSNVENYMEEVHKLSADWAKLP